MNCCVCSGAISSSMNGTSSFVPKLLKNHRRRIIDIEPNLWAWLRKCKRNGDVTPKKNLRTRLRKIRRAAAEAIAKREGISEAVHLFGWRQDIMRHSYASYWLALHGDINKLTLMMDTLRRPCFGSTITRPRKRRKPRSIGSRSAGQAQDRGICRGVIFSRA